MTSFPRRILRIEGQEPPVYPPIYRLPAPAAIANPKNAFEEIIARMGERYGEALESMLLTGEGQAEARGLLEAGRRMNSTRMFSFLYGGSVTGRMSSREPDMQRIPRGGSAMDRLRAMSARGSRVRFLSTPQEQVGFNWIDLPSREREAPNYIVQSMNAENSILRELQSRGRSLRDTLADPAIIDIETAFPEAARRLARDVENHMADAMSMAIQGFATEGRAAEQASFSIDSLRAVIDRMGEGLRTARISPADYERLRLEEANRLPPDRPLPTTFGSIPLISDPNIPEGRAYILNAHRGLNFGDLEVRVLAWDLAAETPSTPPVPDAIVGDQIIDYKLSQPEPMPIPEAQLKKAVHEATANKRPHYQRLNDAPRSFRKGKGKRR